MSKGSAYMALFLGEEPVRLLQDWDDAKINLKIYEISVALRKFRRNGKINPRRRRNHAGRMAYW